MAQAGSCWRIPSKVRRAMTNQYECNMATPRSNSACTLGSHDVGKLTLPSFSSWSANAPPASAAAEISPAANETRLDGVFIGNLHVLRSRGRDDPDADASH